MLTGAGVLTAYDKRTSNDSIYLGGLLQSLTYIAGISGGSWLVMSNFVNDFKPIIQLKDDEKSWDLHKQLLEGIPNIDPKLFYENNEEEIKLNYNNTKNINQSEVKGYGFLNPIMNLFNLLKLQTFSKDPYENQKKQKPDNILQIFNSSIKQDNLYSFEDTGKKSSFILNLFKSIFYKEKQEKVNSSSKNEKDDNNLKSIFGYYKDLQIEVRSKRSAGFHISFTDYWGRALARKFFTNLARNPNVTMSDCTKLESFRSYKQPLPIICSIEKNPDFTESNLDSHLFEFTPFEFGSWDSSLKAFIPLKFLGSYLNNGSSIYPTENPNISHCITGFDNAGFIMGTSSSLFNIVFVYVYKFLMEVKLDLSNAIEVILEQFGLSFNLKTFNNFQTHPDYALYSPNPFYGYDSKERRGRSISTNPHIHLVDGGNDGQNIPYHPFLNEAREVDLILSFDMSSDLFNFPNGSTLNYSAQRYHNNYSNLNLPYFVLKENYSDETSNYIVKSIFPYVPSTTEFIESTLNEIPFFLGCDLYQDYPELVISNFESNLNKKSPKEKLNYFPPLIVYTSNSNYSFPSNKSTFQLSYTKTEIDGMIENGFNLATFKNSTFYSICIRCAILKREFDRILLKQNKFYDGSYFEIPKTCKQCFDRFCWRKKKKIHDYVPVF